MIWAFFVWYGNEMVRLLRIYVFRGTLKGQCHVDKVIYPHILPIYQTVGNNILFQQDNARPHTCNMASNCLQASHVNTLVPRSIPNRTPLRYYRPAGMWLISISSCQNTLTGTLALNNGKAFHREIYVGFFYACAKCSQNALIKMALTLQNIDLQ